MLNIYTKIFSDASFVDLFLAGKTELNLYFAVLNIDGILMLVGFAGAMSLVLISIGLKFKLEALKLLSLSGLLISFALAFVLLLLAGKYFEKFNLAKAEKIVVENLSNEELSFVMRDASLGSDYSCLSLFKKPENANCNYKLVAEAILEYEKRFYNTKSSQSVK